MKVQGRCHCAQIRYEADIDPDKVSACHCTDCQMLTGSVYRVSVPAAKESFVLLAGQPKVYVKTADSGARRAHSFCSDCGAPVYSSAEVDPPMYSLRVGCLDQRAELPPKKQIWCGSRLAWSRSLAGIPESERQ